MPVKEGEEVLKKKMFHVLVASNLL